MAATGQQFVYVDPTLGHLRSARLAEAWLLVSKITASPSALGGDISFDAGSGRLINLADPTGPQDAATRAYVDAKIQGFTVKAPVRVTSTGSITLSSPGTATFDGVVLSAGDRILVKNQGTASENGIYVFNGSAAAMTRAVDADGSGDLVDGTYVYVREGSALKDTAWVLTTDDVITIGTTAQTWVQFSGLGQITAGAGLTKTSNTLDVGKHDGIVVNADSIGIDLDATAPGLQFTGASPNGKLQVKANTAQGINVSASGVGITLATDSGLLLSSGLQALLQSAGGLGKDANGLYIKTANAALSTSVSGLTVSVDAAGGLQVAAGGLAVKLNGATLATGASGLSVAGLPTLFTVAGAAVNANVTAAMLSKLCGATQTSDSWVYAHLHTPACIQPDFGTYMLSRTIAAYQPLADYPEDGGGYLGPADCSSETKGQVIGFALNPNTAPATIEAQLQTFGLLPYGMSGRGPSQTAFTNGERVYLGKPSTGKYMYHFSDLAAGDRIIQLGYVTCGTSHLMINIQDFGTMPG